MRRFLGPIGLTFAVILAGWIQLGWVRVWPIGSHTINLVVLVVIVVALFQSWSVAMWTALVAGLLLGQYSIWPGYVYPLACLGMVVVGRLLVQRWIAARSSASLIIAITVATVAFYLFLAAEVSLLHAFDQKSLKIVWPEWLTMTIVQSIVHPVVIFFLWRRLTGGSFAKASNFHQPF